MANEVEVNISATEDVSQTTENVASSVTGAMGSTEQAFDTAARSSGRFGAALDMASGAGSQLGGAVGDLGDGIQAFSDLQNASSRRALELARAENDVEQAMVDGEQAAIDLKQATIDLGQSQIDGKQAGLDFEQAQADANQAMIDAETAQTAYNDAVAEYGPNSVEAKQAAADLAQANIDLKQANIDAEQATSDKAQAEADAAQATTDMKQANVDAKGSALDLAEAQSEVATQSSGLHKIADEAGMIAPVIMSVVGAIDLLTLANTALNAAQIRAAVSSAALKVAQVAGAVATGVATAAQWLWNAAFAASGIGLIVIGIAALIAGIIYLATQTTFFQDLWTTVWNFLKEPVQATIDFVVGYVTMMWNFWTSVIGGIKDFFVDAFKYAINAVAGYFEFIWSLPGRFWNVFKSIGDAVWQPLKYAFNMVAWAWNNTVGRLSFTIPSWVPGIGGNGFSMPRLPMLATGGDIVRTGMAVIHKGERIVPAGSTALGASAGDGGALRLEINLTGATPELRRWIQKNTRAFGGGGPNAVQIAWS